MLSLILMAASISVVVSVGSNECDGKNESYTFSQVCNECWCRHGKPVCTNQGCRNRKLMKNSSSVYKGPVDDNGNNDSARELTVAKGNAIGIHAWDLHKKFPKKEKKATPVTPYPPYFRSRFNLQQPIFEKEQQTVSQAPAFNQPDAGGLNVLRDEEVPQYEEYPKYQPYLYHPGFPKYPVYPIYPWVTG